MPLTNDGDLIAAIAAIHGLPHGTGHERRTLLSRIKQDRAAATAAEGPKRLTHEQRVARRAKAAAIIRNGGTFADAARDTGLTIGTIREACKQHGVTPPRANGPRDRTLQIAAELGRGESTPSEIARKYGVSRQHAHAIKQRAQPQQSPRDG